MEKPHHYSQYATPEQLAYAALLDWGMKIGFVLLLISFLFYLTGILPPYIPLAELPHYWHMPAGQYLKEAQVPHGWGWVNLISKGDFFNFVGMAFLSAVTVGCYLRILPLLIKNRDVVYIIIAVLEVLVLVLAASGILVMGH